jgi:hypothetical protein
VTVVGLQAARVLEVLTAVPVIRPLACAGARLEFCFNTRAAVPAAYGVAIEVPERVETRRPAPISSSPWATVPRSSTAGIVATLLAADARSLVQVA